MAEQESKCPECGGPVETGKPCPNCLLQMVAQSTEQFDTGADDFPDSVKQLPQPVIPDIRTVRQAFPQLEIIDLIGRGGMGTVFKARQPKLDRFVALKILSEKLAEKPAFAERFAQEGKLLARLSYPNIVSVYDYGEADGFYYLILEYVDGVNLRQAMREKRFSSDQALTVVSKICETLQYAHDEGVLHRDIKPENILLDTKGRVKIADFGIAKLMPQNGLGNEISETSNITDTDLVLGTPNYMAPEQRDDPNDVDHRADIYSLGVVFYELLTGEVPKGRFVPPSEVTPLNTDIDEIVQQALQHDRDKRFQSAGEFKTGIETVTQSKKPQKTEPFPFFPDLPEFAELTYKNQRNSAILFLFICLFSSIIALLDGPLFFRLLAIFTIIGFGGLFIARYLLFKYRRKWHRQLPGKIVTEISMTPRLTKTALATLALSVLVFLVNVPAFYTLYLGPQNAARSEYNLARSAEQQIKEEMASDRLTAEVLQRDNETDNFTTQITNAAQQEVTEARQKINASYLKKAEHETQQLLGEYEKLVAERTPGVQGILGTLLLLPLFLLVISLFSGHVQLKHVQQNDDKPGLLGATASVLLSTLLFPVLLTVSLGLFLAWKEVIR